MAINRAYRFVGLALASSILAAFLFLQHGAEMVLSVATIVVCAYVNVFLLKLMLSGTKQRKAKKLGLIIGAIVANLAVLYVTDASLLVAVAVWLPAIAGILSAWFLSNRGG